MSFRKSFNNDAIMNVSDGANSLRAILAHHILRKDTNLLINRVDRVIAKLNEDIKTLGTYEGIEFDSALILTYVWTEFSEVLPEGTLKDISIFSEPIVTLHEYKKVNDLLAHGLSLLIKESESGGTPEYALKHVRFAYWKVITNASILILKEYGAEEEEHYYLASIYKAIHEMGVILNLLELTKFTPDNVMFYLRSTARSDLELSMMIEPFCDPPSAKQSQMIRDLEERMVT